MQVRFLGAAREVTGSCHEVTVEGRRLLLDCGMWQGARDEAREKNRAFALRGKNIHAILLSHAHIDHSGNLPQLVDSGFRGTVWCTPATRDLARVLLLDSASIAARDVAYLKKRERRAVEPLFTESDVERILAARRFARLRLADLVRLRLAMKKVMPFIIAADHTPVLLDLDGDSLRARFLPPPQQLELNLETPPPSDGDILASRSGEL